MRDTYLLYGVGRFEWHTQRNARRAIGKGRRSLTQRPGGRRMLEHQ